MNEWAGCSAALLSSSFLCLDMRIIRDDIYNQGEKSVMRKALSLIAACILVAVCCSGLSDPVHKMEEYPSSSGKPDLLCLGRAEVCHPHPAVHTGQLRFRLPDRRLSAQKQGKVGPHPGRVGHL